MDQTVIDQTSKLGRDPPEHVTFFLDGNASRVLTNGFIDYTRVGTLLEEVRDCSQRGGILPLQALPMVTVNGANRLGIGNERSSLRESYFADLALFTEAMGLTDLMGVGYCGMGLEPGSIHLNEICSA
jgi:adenine deaminase